MRTDFKDAFKRTVIDEFVDEYTRGRTPNPCVLCNQWLKFGSLRAKALTLGCIRDIKESRWGRLSVGGDATFYHVPDNMLDYYGTSPHSFHAFVRYRPRKANSMAHVH